MATITTRSGKGSPLTNNEVDANFTNLNNDKQEVLAEGSFADGDKTKLDGIESGATADQTAQEIATAIDADATAEATLKSALGLGTAAYTASTDYATAAQGALADSALQSIPDNYILNTGDAITGNLSFGDNNKAIFGAGSDLQIYHDGTNSWVKESNATGSMFVDASNLYLRSDTGEAYLAAVKDSYVRLYYDDAVKLATTSTGIDVTGTVTADGLTVDGDVTLGNGATLKIDDQDSILFGTYSGGSTGTLLQGGTSTDYLTYVGGKKRQTIATNGDISFYEDTGTTAKFFWDASAESLGIGTSSPSQTLDVNGNVNSRDGAFRLSTVTSGRGGLYTYDRVTGSGTDYSVGLFSETGLGGLWFATGGSVTKRMVINDSGNVGIGTSSPSGVLHLSANTATTTLPSIVFQDTGTTATRLGSLTNNGGDLTLAMTASLTDLRAAVTLFDDRKITFGTASSERMRIDSSGNLLVGTTSDYAVDSTTATGAKIKANGMGAFYRDGGTPLYVSRGEDGTIVDFRKDGTTVGSIGTFSSRPYISTSYGSTSGIRFDSNFIIPCSATGSGRDAAIDLGLSTVRYKDLYLSGGVYLGGTGSANYLDDYEEGTFNNSTMYFATSGSVSMNQYLLKYTKIGTTVTVTGNLHFDVVSSQNGALKISLPFAAGSGTQNRAIGFVGNYETSEIVVIKIESGSSYGLMVTPVNWATHTITNSDTRLLSFVYHTDA